MTVDVVIPAHNRPALLQEAVRSVLAQTHTELRLFVVDDASPAPLAESLSVSDTRLQIIRSEKNIGPGQARNLGARKGLAPLIAFLDSDDLWQRDKLQKQVEYMAAHPDCQWLHTHELWLRDSKEVKQKAVHRKEGGRFLVRAFERCLISPSAVMLRRSFFEKHGGFARHFFVCEDYELWLRLLADAPVGFIAEPLTIKRAGNWEQLSSARELDRFRVLALHRFYRQMRRDTAMTEYIEALLAEAEKKSQILHNGAQKYGHTARARKYQTWFTLFNTRRTRLMR